MTNDSKPLPKSQRILNYTKASASGVAAIGALVALILGGYNTLRDPDEHIARKTHEDVEVQVNKISSDMQRAFEDRREIEATCEARVAALREDMKVFLNGVTMGLSVAQNVDKPRVDAKVIEKLTKPTQSTEGRTREFRPQEQRQAPRQYKMRPLEQMAK